MHVKRSSSVSQFYLVHSLFVFIPFYLGQIKIATWNAETFSSAYLRQIECAISLVVNGNSVLRMVKKQIKIDNTQTGIPNIVTRNNIV